MIDNVNVLPDFEGIEYHDILSRLHEITGHTSYLEIGTLRGATLALSKSRSIAIDPAFKLQEGFLGTKPSCLLFQLPSDEFFAQYNATALLGSSVEFAFLDGMHHAEFLLRDFINTEAVCGSNAVIAMHDCIPLELPMADRVQEGTPAILPHRQGWWTGDVWKAALAIKRRRPDLVVTSFDCPPTGLVVITGLDSASKTLSDNYDEIITDMAAMDLAVITVQGLHDELGITSTSDFSWETIFKTDITSRIK